MPALRCCCSLPRSCCCWWAVASAAPPNRTPLRACHRCVPCCSAAVLCRMPCLCRTGRHAPRLGGSFCQHALVCASLPHLPMCVSSCVAAKGMQLQHAAPPACAYHSTAEAASRSCCCRRCARCGCSCVKTVNQSCAAVAAAMAPGLWATPGGSRGGLHCTLVPCSPTTLCCGARPTCPFRNGVGNR